MAHTYYYVVFFDPKKQDKYGMPDPFNSYIFFLQVNQQLGLTDVEIYAADDKTKVPRPVQAVQIKKTNVKQVCDEVFDLLQALPANTGLQWRRYF